MSIINSLETTQFIANIWQKKSHLFRQSCSDLIDIIDGNELAGLACEPECEARIIQGRKIDGPWSCLQGPFDEGAFADLPEKDWTLLVQGVDQWIDEVRDILSEFSAIPQWRLEDIMASYAPQGGGVGPHFDYYDVFLIQISGTRTWQLAQQCDESTPLQNHEQVKLLPTFDTQEEHTVEAGDMLYIPAGKAHWGVASSDDCITFSIGFRAPSQKELLSSALEHIVDGLSDTQRYQDNAAAIDTHPDKINSAVHQQLTAMLQALTPKTLQEAVNQSFGELVTEPRHAPIDAEIMSEDDILNYIDTAIAQQSDLHLYRPPHSRLAFSASHLFVNGEAYEVNESFAQSVCDGVIPFAMIEDDYKSYLVEWIQNSDVVFDDELMEGS